MTELSLNSGEDFEKILKLYSTMVYRLAYARTGSVYDAEDILQEVFFRYVKSKMTFNDENHRKAWLLKVTSNCSKTLLTSPWNSRRNDTDAQKENSSIFHEDSDIQHKTEKDDFSQHIRQSVNTMPEKYRIVVHLFYFEDMSVEEISRTLKLGSSAVKTRLHRARKMLKERLERIGIYEWE